MEALRPSDPGRVGSYRLLGRLGAGGMGQVYLGVSPGGRQVAVKLIHPAHADAAQFRERFAREIEAAQRVGGFHTAPVVDADPHADPPWMVTAYIDGPALQEAVGRHGPLPPDRVRALGAGLAEGLGAIHARGLVHRDLKPGNVIMAADGPRIIDFGIARAMDATSGITSTGVVVGTFAYMSPEQLRGAGAGPASDVFALGCVLAFAATGRPPFGSEPAATVMFRIVAEPPDLAGLADDRLRNLIGGCLAKEPAARPTVLALLTALGSPDPALARAPLTRPPLAHTSVTHTPGNRPLFPTGPRPEAPSTQPPPTTGRVPTTEGTPPATGGRPPATGGRPAHGRRSASTRRRRPAALAFAAAAVLAAALAIALPILLTRHPPKLQGPSTTPTISAGHNGKVLIDVPNVVHDSPAKATRILEAAGFKVQVSAAPGGNYVDDYSPDTPQPRGATITIDLIP